jgi:CheY-like chemotaxis protein
MSSSCRSPLAQPQTRLKTLGSCTSCTVLIVEDEASWQKAFTSLLQSEEGVEVSAVCSTYTEALRLYQEQRPDWVLLDWHIEGEPDGLALAAQLMSLGHAAERLLLVSGSDTEGLDALPYRKVSKSSCAVALLPLLRESFA